MDWHHYFDDILWFCNLLCGMVIVLHAACSLSCTKFRVSDFRLWGHGFELGGGVAVLLRYASYQHPDYAEVLINVGIACFGLRRGWLLVHDWFAKREAS